MLDAAHNTQVTTMRTSAVAVAAALANNKGQQQQQAQPKQNQQQQQQVKQQVAPNLSEIMGKLQTDYGNYKYTVYRCASKFIALQKIFHSKQSKGSGRVRERERWNELNALPLQLEKYRINWCWPYWNGMECPCIRTVEATATST